MTKDSFKTKSGTVIMFEQFDADYYETLQYLKFADRVMSACVNSSSIKKKYRCQIFIMTDGVKGGLNIIEDFETVSIYLNKNFRTVKNKFKIVTKMINAMLLAKTGFKAKALKLSLPSWIIVGIYGRLELRFSSHSVLQVSYFPGLKALCQAGKLPDFRVAVSTSLSPDEDGTAYQLYQEFCRFLLLELKRLSSRSDNPVADLIFLNARKKYSSNEAFDSTIVRAIVKSYDKIHRRKERKFKPKKVHSAEKVQKWFEEIAEKRLINLNSPLPTKFFEERFKRFRKFSYNYTTKDKRTRQLTRDISRLDEIFDEYGMSLEFREMMRKKMNEIGELSRVCQPLSRDSIEEIRKLLNQFDNMSSVTIRVRLVKVLAKLKQTLAKQQKIEDYLRKIEYTTVEPGKLYRNELIEDKRLKAKFCPSINKYLDKIEKSFLKD